MYQTDSDIVITVKMLLCFFFALIAAVYSRIFRLPCKSLAHFDVILDGFALTNTPAIATHHQSSRRQCVLHCISNPHCKSLNHNGLTSVCKLFNVGFNNATQSLGAVVGWSFLAATDEVIFANFFMLKFCNSN